MWNEITGTSLLPHVYEMRNVRVLKSGAGPSSRTKLLCRLRNSSESDIFGSSGHSFAFARTIFLCAWRDSTVPYRRCDAARASSNTSSATAPVSKRLSSFNVFSFNKAKFHYTDTDTYPTRTRHGPDRTRTDFFCGETPLGPCGSGRVRVVEFR